jgi:hypothetical protein
MQMGKATSFLYKLGIVLFKRRLFLITSNGELRRNRHDIYVKHKQQTINKQYTKQ